MKKIAVLLIVFCVSFSFAQKENKKVKYEQKDDLVAVTYYYDNGKIEQQGFFKDEKLHGTWKYFNDEGEKIAVGIYEHGKKAGKWVFWNDNGIKEVDYVDGKIMTVNEVAETSSL